MKKVTLYELNNRSITSKELSFYKIKKEEHPLINVYDEKITKIIGFGGAITEASAYNYSLLSTKDKKKVILDLFGPNGLCYNFCRIPIGSNDFTYTGSYSYIKENDFELKTFSIDHDLKYVIPFIKDALNINKDIIFLASPWSPPAFLKDNKCLLHGGKLLKKYYSLYAKYLIKFIFAYQKHGINITYLSIQNEQKAIQTWESCTFNVFEEIEFSKILKKELKKNNLNIKILCWDHNKERVVKRSLTSFKEGNLFSGAAFHWYTGDHFDAIKYLRHKFPNKLLVETEFCTSIYEDNVPSLYFDEYLNCISSGANGFIEWNLIVDSNGGPFHDRRKGCYAPITLKEDNSSYLKDERYFQTYLFSHFIHPGAASFYTSSFNDFIKVSAIKNIDGTIVINLNNHYKDMTVKVCIKNYLIDVPIKKDNAYALILE